MHRSSVSPDELLVERDPPIVENLQRTRKKNADEENNGAETAANMEKVSKLRKQTLIAIIRASAEKDYGKRAGLLFRNKLTVAEIASVISAVRDMLSTRTLPKGADAEKVENWLKEASSSQKIQYVRPDNAYTCTNPGDE